MINILKVSCLIIATIIGAGFSSGREIYTFFNLYKENIFFILITTYVTFYFTIYYILKLSYEKNIENYSDFINIVYGKKYKNLISIIFNIFLLIIFSIMISGFGEFINITLGINKIYGSVILLIICFLTLLKNIEGIIKVSVIIVPIIIFSIISLFIIEVNNNIAMIINNIKDINYFSGVIYASYNLVIAIPVIVTSSKKLKNSREIKYTSLVSSMVLIILIIIIYWILNNYLYIIQDVSMPLLEISQMQNKLMYNIYKIVICISIYTTAISTQYSLVQGYSRSKYLYAIFSTGIIGLIISFVSFNKLIEIGFLIIGIVGIMQTIFIIKCMKFNKKK